MTGPTWSVWALWLNASQPALANPIPSPGAVQNMDEIESAIDCLRLPRNHYVHRDAIKLLLERPDEAQPRLLARLSQLPVQSSAIIDILGQIGRVEAVTGLAERLGEDRPDVSLKAAIALAKISDPAAAKALTDAVSSGDELRAQAGLFGLGRRGEAAHCEPVLQATRSDSGTVRYYAVRAADEMGCVDDAGLERFANDPDPDVRTLIQQRLQSQPPTR